VLRRVQDAVTGSAAVTLVDAASGAYGRCTPGDMISCFCPGGGRPARVLHALYCTDYDAEAVGEAEATVVSYEALYVDLATLGREGDPVLWKVYAMTNKITQLEVPPMDDVMGMFVAGVRIVHKKSGGTCTPTLSQLVHIKQQAAEHTCRSVVT
jgi:hypothetical protein